jgi:hypothetical protein
VKFAEQKRTLYGLKLSNEPTCLATAITHIALKKTAASKIIRHNGGSISVQEIVARVMKEGKLQALIYVTRLTFKFTIFFLIIY